MDFSIILAGLAAKFPWAALGLAILGMLVVIGSAVVAMTPSKADDEAWDKIKNIPVLGSILSALANFSPIQKK